MTLWQHIALRISDRTGTPFTPHPPRHIGGGCINQAYKLSDGCQHWFVKVNSVQQIAMFEAEAEGLNTLADSASIQVPRPLLSDTFDDSSYLVMAYIEHGRARRDSQAIAGRQLAQMHRHQSEHYGWHRHNTIGTTPQQNDWHNDWISFWRDRRIGFQLNLAAQNRHTGALQRRGEQLLSRLGGLLNHQPVASLLHGDLWGGNIAFDTQGQPIIFDPAVYYGDRETDLAMTELFGGFSADFYAAYREAWPLPDGYRVRRKLYNLYHVLNHLNLFGGSYAGQAQDLIEQLLAEC